MASPFGSAIPNTKPIMIRFCQSRVGDETMTESVMTEVYTEVMSEFTRDQLPVEHRKTPYLA